MSGILTFAKDELGIDLTAAQAEALSSYENEGNPFAVWQWGRRGGKSLMSDIIALYDVAARDDELRSYLRPGEPRISAIICPRLDQAEAHIATCASLVEQSPRLKRLLKAQTADTLTFANAATIRAFPCSARGIRGGAWSSCVLDELGHFVGTDDGNAAGDRILEAALPSLAQFGSHGWLVAISTPLWKSGAFWTLVERATSGRFNYHYRHHTTAEANPRISAEWLAERQREDPEMYSREFLAQFVDGAFGYLMSSDVIAARREGGTLPPQSGFKYVGALDPAYSFDNFSMAIAHTEKDLIVVDGVWTWRRHGHAATLDEVAAIAKRYGVTTLRTDQHSPVPIREGLAERSIYADYQPWTNESKSNAFAALKVAINTSTVELPNDPALIEELCGLEARPTPSGLTRIAASAGRHDDRAVVVASVVEALTTTGRNAVVAIWGDETYWADGQVTIGNEPHVAGRPRPIDPDIF